MEELFPFLGVVGLASIVSALFYISIFVGAVAVLLLITSTLVSNED